MYEVGSLAILETPDSASVDDEFNQFTPSATFISSLEMQTMVVLEANCSTKLDLPPNNSLAECGICDLQAIF